MSSTDKYDPGESLLFNLDVIRIAASTGNVPMEQVMAAMMLERLAKILNQIIMAATAAQAAAQAAADAVEELRLNNEGAGTMRLVHFLDGTKDIWVNPEDVASLEETAATRTKIQLSTGVSYTVDGAHGAIAATIASDLE